MNRIGIFAAAIALGGCGTVKIESELVAEKDQHAYLASPGVYYSLPKSEVTVVIPVTLERQVKGFKGNILDDCLSACRAQAVNAPNASTQDACTIPTANETISLGKPTVALTSVRDPKRLYRLNVGGGFLDGVSHTMNVAENGILTDSKSTVTSQGAELALTLVSEVAKTAVGFAKFRPPSPSSNEPKTELSCQAAEAIQAKDDAFTAEIGKVEKRRDELLIPGSGAAQRLTAAQLKLADERLKFQIAQIQAKQGKYYATEDLTEVKKTYKTSLSSKPLSPEENQSLSAQPLGFGPLVDAENDSLLKPDLQQQLTTALRFVVDITPQRTQPALQADASPEPSVAGYRYRVPVPGTLTLSCQQSGATSSQSSPCPASGWAVISSQNLPIAQYGPIASLPQEFKGKGATVGIGIHPLSAGIKNVEIGVEPVSAKALTDAVGSVRTAIDDRKTRDAEQAKERLEAEKNDLSRERDILTLRKEIRDLQKDLSAP